MIGLFTGYLRRMKGLSKDKDIYITGRIINDPKMPGQIVYKELALFSSNPRISFHEGLCSMVNAGASIMSENSIGLCL